MTYDFRWIAWNLDKLAKHGMQVQQVEYVANHPGRGYPKRIDRDKFLVRGRTDSGEYVQVIYLVDTDGVLFVIHARPLTDAEKRKFRRRRR